MSEDCLEMALPAEPSSETDEGKVAKRCLVQSTHVLLLLTHRKRSPLLKESARI